MVVDTKLENKVRSVLESGEWCQSNRGTKLEMQCEIGGGVLNWKSRICTRTQKICCIGDARSERASKQGWGNLPLKLPVVTE